MTKDDLGVKDFLFPTLGGGASDPKELSELVGASVAPMVCRMTGLGDTLRWIWDLWIIYTKKHISSYLHLCSLIQVCTDYFQTHPPGI